MKTFSFFVFIIFISGTLAAQSYKVVPLIENEQVLLRSGSHSLTTGSNSRSYVPINIPQDATTIIYTVGTTLDYDGNNNLKLAAKVGALLSGHYAMASVIDRIDIPKSLADIEVYLLEDYANASKFVDKKDGYWKHFPNCACPGTLGCKRAVSVSNYSGRTLYIGLRNPSTISRIVAVVNVVAIVQEPEYQSNYSSYNESQSSNFENTENSTNTNTYGERINYANSPSPQNGWGSKEISELTGKYGDLYLLQLRENNQSVSHKFLIEFVNCMVAYIVSEYRYEYYLMLNTTERKNAYDKSSRHCTSAMND